MQNTKKAKYEKGHVDYFLMGGTYMNEGLYSKQAYQRNQAMNIYPRKLFVVVLKHSILWTTQTWYLDMGNK